MSLNALLGVACIVSFTLPIAAILYNRFYTHRSLAALMIYYTIITLDNLMAEGIIPVPRSFSMTFGVINNFLDVPLMLTTLIFFCPNRQKQRFVNWLTLAFIAYEVVIAFLHGLQPRAIIYVMGPGIIIILVYSFYLFLRQVKFSILHGKNQGRTVMLAAIFFMYATYAFIYYFYYIVNTPHKTDTFMLYFIASGLSAIMMGIGLHMMRKRMKELQTLKTTRKELALFFGQ